MVAFVNAVQQRLPAFRPLTLVLKYFLQTRQLNDTYHGGVGSFMLQMMVLSHLQVGCFLPVQFLFHLYLFPDSMSSCSVLPVLASSVSAWPVRCQ